MPGVPAAVHAQVSGGVRAGANLADLVFEPTPPVDSKNLTGLVAGGFVTVPITPVFAFQPEALYGKQGTKFSEQGQTLKLEIDYVQVPLLARFAAGAHSPIAIVAGPSFGFRTRARTKGSDGLSDVDEDFTDDVNAFDPGLVAGVEIDAGHAVFDARYTWGLTNIVKPSPGGPAIDVDPGSSGTAKHRLFSITAGFRF